MTGTVTAFWRELRGSGSFMDTDRGGVNRFLRSYGVARLREGFRKMAWGASRMLTFRKMQKRNWLRKMHPKKVENAAGEKVGRTGALEREDECIDGQDRARSAGSIGTTSVGP